MKRLFIFLFLAILLIPARGIAQSNGQVLDRIVAIIGDEIITDSELQLQMLQAGMQNEVNANDPALRQRILEAMMNDKLVLAQAVLDSIQIPPEEITARLEDQIKRLTRYYGSEQRLEEIAGMPIYQMKREFREDIRKRLMIDMIQQQKFGSMIVSHREVQEFFKTYSDSLPPVPEQVELRQLSIFPRVTDAFKSAAREKAQSLLDSIRGGADFEELARRHSDDPGSAKNGGSLGLVRRGLFVKEFEEAAYALEPGEISEVVETQFGFHIIKLLEKKGEAIKPQHILVKIEKTGESDQTTINQLNELRQRILDGEDFETLAKEYSEDEETRKFGGSLGAIEVPELSDELKSIQQRLKVGEITDPVKITMGESDYTYAIVRLEKRIAPHPPTLENDYQRVAKFAKIFKQNRKYADWLEEIKKNVFWKINL